MHNLFKEGDIISAEVMQVNSQDGKISLQTRNAKYGKLANGFLLKIDSNFVRRMKQHIMTLETPQGSVRLILGTNGYLWIQSETQLVSAQTRMAMAVIRNSIVSLQSAKLPIFKETIEKVVAKYYQICDELGLRAAGMLEKVMVDGKHLNEEKEVELGEVLVSEAREMIAREIEQNQKDLNLAKLVEQMDEREFIDFHDKGTS